jgi:hypothetical protein
MVRSVYHPRIQRQGNSKYYRSKDSHKDSMSLKDVVGMGWDALGVRKDSILACE